MLQGPYPDEFIITLDAKKLFIKESYIRDERK